MLNRHMNSRLISNIFLFTLVFFSLLIIAACEQQTDKPKQAADITAFECDEDNGGLLLPDGFCAAVIADNLGIVRHIAVRKADEIYASLRNRSLNVGGLLVLADTDGDHVIDSVKRIGEAPGMGIKIYGDYLYFASDKDVVRYRLSESGANLLSPPETVIKNFPEQTQHAGKPFTIDRDGHLYINVGSKSNACQSADRVVGQSGQDPCPELSQHAGIWRFDANQLDQSFADGVRYASGIRNAYAIDWHRGVEKLYVVQHGRDHLHELWPNLYSPSDEARLPAEELIEVNKDAIYAWPYCYYDPFESRYVLAPEYSGDGKLVGRCQNYPEPIIAFPAHYGPNDLVIYHGDQFPDAYQGGAFIAFHGSYLVNSTEQVGYQIVFVKRAEKGLSSEWQVFADQFAGKDSIQSPQDADYRPTGLAIGEDGSLYISDSVQGRIWRVIYKAEQK